jgi:hypothetical protein
MFFPLKNGVPEISERSIDINYSFNIAEEGIGENNVTVIKEVRFFNYISTNKEISF